MVTELIKLCVVLFYKPSYVEFDIVDKINYLFLITRYVVQQGAYCVFLRKIKLNPFETHSLKRSAVLERERSRYLSIYPGLDPFSLALVG